MNRNRTNFVVLLVLFAAIAVLLSLRIARIGVTEGEIVAICILSALALVAEFLALLLPRGARGSISFIPGLAAVIIAPSWATVAAIAAIKVIVESARKVEFERALFNIAQYAVSTGVAIWVFVQAGGSSFLLLGEQSLSTVTASNGVAAIAAFAASFLVNSILVAIVMSADSGTPLGSFLRSNHLTTIGIDILAAPLIFVFAWIYVRFGPMAAATLWVPIVGIRQVHKTNLELERNNEELLELMVKSIEARDPYTSGHSRRVQEYSVRIARALHLAERDVELVSRAALLHDVGKIHEKYGPILSKADKLTAEEWQTMKEHSEDGANLIATMTPLRGLVDLVRHHHENWDGTGYPTGLAGELIPLHSRVIRFADTIDAMTTQRPYRPGMGEAEVRAELVRCRATQFDPNMVDRLLSSPIWRSMFAPDERVGVLRYGISGIVGGGQKREERVVGA